MVILTFKEKGKLPYDQERKNSFFVDALKHGWTPGEIVPVGDPAQWLVVDYMIPPKESRSKRVDGHISLSTPTMH